MSSSNSVMQGPHQVAHTLMKRILPESLFSRIARSVAASAFSSVHRLGGPLLLVVGVVRHLVGPLDRATEHFRGGDFRRLAGEQRIECRTRVMRGRRRLAFRVVDAPFEAQDLRVLSKMKTCGVATGPYACDIDLRRAVVQPDEVEFFLFGALLHFFEGVGEIRIRQLIEPHRIGVIRVDGDQRDVPGRVVGGQLLDALLVGLRRRAMHAGEHHHEDVGLGEALVGVSLAVDARQ